MAEAKTIVIKEENVNPVDSFANVKEKLDPRAYGSCALTVPGRCLGCRAFEACEEPEKGAKQPEFYGVREIKSKERGAGVREQVLPCFVYWAQKEAKEAGGSIYRIVKRAGGTVTEKGSRPLLTIQDPQYPSDPTKRLPAPGTSYVDEIRERVVPEWEGIEKNLKLINAAYAAAILEKEREDQLDRTERDRLADASGAAGIAREPELAKPIRRPRNEGKGDGRAD